ncbi:MAG: DNA polymerase I [Rikenellaceae bacterium]|nr:DNA polymerase I [Rikenellaceae bacterium]
MDRLFLVDAYALIFRSYYAFINRPMRNREGLNTSAIFGFTKFINDIIKKENPSYIGVAFDPPGGNFRHELFDDYKANRHATPEDITASVPYIKDILKAMRIPILEIPGYEADDVIGTLSVKAAKEDFKVYMVTPDKDFGQLVQPSVYIYKQRKNGEGIEIVDMDKVKEHYGIDDPTQIIDVLALWGDASDNIPGVPGIGEKTAIKLVCQYGTVEQILENVTSVKGKLGENIAAHSEQILLSKKLAAIDTEVPIEFEPECLRMERPDYDNLKKIYLELGFASLLKGMGDEIVRNTTGNDLFSSASVSTEAKNVQTDLFSATPQDTVSIDNTEHSYRTVSSQEDINELAEKLSSCESFSFTTETSGPDVFNDRILGVAISFSSHEAHYILLDSDKEKAKQILDKLKPVFQNKNISKCGYNIKTDIMFLSQYGIEVKGFLYDVMILHYLLDPESTHRLDYLARKYLNYESVGYESIAGKGVRQLSLDLVPVNTVSEYSCETADNIHRLKEILWKDLEANQLTELYSNIEEPLIRVLASMEIEGIRIDIEGLQEYGRSLEGELYSLEKQIRELAEEPDINVNSSKQLGEVLFGKLKVDPKAKLTKTKQYRTDEEYLRSIESKHPIIELILSYRGLKKLFSTYIEALPKLVNPATGKIHTSFNQAVTATGRLSSNNPNLQNIPIRDEQGRMLRKAFIPSEDGCVIMSADYSQVELRLMAHLSCDGNMLEAFRDEKDIHSATAAKIFGIAEDEVTSEQRRRAKTANFGIIYGISAFGLSQRLTIPRSEAKEIIEGYFATYQGVKKYMEKCVEDARIKGYVSTIYGRKRFIPDINSRNANVRGFAERNAINAPIQGSAADIIKIAMICVDKRLKEAGLRSRIILQVHDELVLNVFTDEIDTVENLVVECMENAAHIAVPLIAECGYGNNWLEAH